MAKAKQSLSPRQRYAAIKAAQMKNEKLYDFIAPSGMLFKLRAPDMELFLTSGVVPLGLADKTVKAIQAAGGDAVKAMRTLTTAEHIKTIAFASKMVRYCCAIPEIVDIPDPDNESQIAPEDVLTVDYTAIVKWAVSGGDEANRLGNFSGK